MADTEVVNINVTSCGETTSSLIEKLGAAFTELEAQKIAATLGVQWNDVQEHLSHLESMVKKKLEELEAKKKAFSERESNNRELIAAREAEVQSVEQDMQDKVQELKDAAVAAIEEVREMYKPGDTDGNQVHNSIENENAPLDFQEGKSPSHEEDNEEDREMYMPDSMDHANCGDMDGNVPLDAQEGKSPSQMEDHAKD